MTEDELKEVAGQLRKPSGKDAIETGERMNINNRHIYRYTLDAIRPAAGAHIVEIGMGNGHFVEELLEKEKDLTYTGVDYSEEMVTEATNRNKDAVRTGRAHFIHSDAARMPLPDNSADWVFTVNTLYFWEDIPATLAEIYRILRPGGRLLIAVRPKRSMQFYPFVRFGFNLFDREDIEQMLAGNNFEGIESIEQEEPDAARFDTTLKIETLIVMAQKR